MTADHHPHQLTTPDAIRAFIRAGNAHFTIVSKHTGARFTYRVRAPKPQEPGQKTFRSSTDFFVGVLSGSDNESAYAYLGFLKGDVYCHGKKSRVNQTAPSARAFAWFWKALQANRLEPVEFWHEGRCGRCARKLTVPESIASGYGPECAGRMAV
jgi:hypothetical protein